MASQLVISTFALSSGFSPRRLFSGCHYVLHPGHGGVNKRTARSLAIKTPDFSEFLFGGGGNEGKVPPLDPTAGASITASENKEKPQCPPGLRQYETMVVLRPDLTEDQRLTLTQKFEELLINGGGMYVQVFNRGVIPLAYKIMKKNREGENKAYLDGIYLLFTYFTRPESIIALETRLKADYNVIRSSTFKLEKKKHKPT